MKILITVFLTLTAFGPVYGFSTDNVNISRTFDTTVAQVDTEITVSVSFTNNEASSLYGFFYTEQIPDYLVVTTQSVKINGAELTEYLTEVGESGEVYADCTPYRWILSTPPAFTQTDPVSSGSTVDIVFTVQSSTAGTYNLDEFSWGGFFLNDSQAAFGHSEDVDKQVLTFTIADHSHPPRAMPWVLLLLLGD